ncbi:hypothetical protein D3C78_1964660 [compost metagenome]
MVMVMVSINHHPDVRRAFDGVHFETLDIRYTTANPPAWHGGGNAGESMDYQDAVCTRSLVRPIGV